jgi:hypothetical protein
MRPASRPEAKAREHGFDDPDLKVCVYEVAVKGFSLRMPCK